MTAAVGASFLRWLHVHRALAFDLDALRAACGRRRDAELLPELATLLGAEAPSWEAELVSELAAANTRRARTAVINEALHDIDRALAWGVQIDRAAPRCAAAGPLGVLFWSLARQTLTVSEVLPVFAWGVAGFVACAAIGRASERLMKQRRRGIDMWVDQLLLAVESANSM